jgi:hypothetical protein
LQSLVREYQAIPAIDALDSGLIDGRYFRKQEKLAQKAVDEFRAELAGANSPAR